MPETQRALDISCKEFIIKIYFPYIKVTLVILDYLPWIFCTGDHPPFMQKPYTLPLNILNGSKIEMFGKLEMLKSFHKVFFFPMV